MNSISDKKSKRHSFALKVPKIIQLSILFLLLGTTIALGKNMYSQSIMINLHLENATIEEVINNIEEQSEFRFLYNKKIVNVERKVSISADEKNIADVLDVIFQDTDISYVINDRHIVLNKRSNYTSFDEMQQTRVITGTIVDENDEPIIGANVLEKGTLNGAITNSEGKFSINVPAGTVLQISFVGFTTQEVNIGNRTQLTIRLAEDNKLLDELVVVGYGTMRKKDLTGSIAQIKTDKLIKENPATIQDLLRSGVPGLNVDVNASAKGGGSLQIRGQRSLSANNDPLIVLNNVVFFGELSEINPQDIEQIDILKDASSAAIYGAKSANGVVIITTKKGRTERPTVRFDANLGIVTMGKHRDVYDAEGYLNFRGDWYTSTGGFGNNPGKYYAPTQENLAKHGITINQWRGYTSDTGGDDEKWLNRLGLFPKEQENYFAGNTYDWYDEAYRIGIRQDYNVSLSGRGNKMNYYLSMGYLDSKGLIIGDDYTSIRSNMKIDATVNNFLTIGANVNFQNRTDGNLAVSTENVLLSNSPFSLPYDENGNLIYRPMGTN